jgi:hypothetical protein
MNWTPVQDGSKEYCLKHIHPSSFVYQVKDISITIRVTYGFHVFTDEKGSGCLINHYGDERYFSQARYDMSLELPA